MSWKSVLNGSVNSTLISRYWSNTLNQTVGSISVNFEEGIFAYL